MKDPEFYTQLTQKRIENIRYEVRHLIQYLKTSSRNPVYTDIEDSEINVGEPKLMELDIKFDSIYKKRVESFIRENKHEITISKLSSNEPITMEELHHLEKILFDGERGTKEDFVRIYGKKPLGEFILSIIGMDSEAANKAFADFLQAGNLRADQMTFINTIITYLTQNGTIDKKMLFEPPFTDVNDQGLLGVFDDAEAIKIIGIIDEINGRASIG